MELSAWMAATGRTNAALADEVGVAENTVNRWRNKWRRPRQKVMARIHEISGGKVTPNDFFVLQDEPRAAAKCSGSTPGENEPVHRDGRRAPLEPVESSQ